MSVAALAATEVTTEATDAATSAAERASSAATDAATSATSVSTNAETSASENGRIGVFGMLQSTAILATSVAAPATTKGTSEATDAASAAEKDSSAATDVATAATSVAASAVTNPTSGVINLAFDVDTESNNKNPDNNSTTESKAKTEETNSSVENGVEDKLISKEDMNSSETGKIGVLKSTATVATSAAASAATKVTSAATDVANSAAEKAKSVATNAATASTSVAASAATKAKHAKSAVTDLVAFDLDTSAATSVATKATSAVTDAAAAATSAPKTASSAATSAATAATSAVASVAIKATSAAADATNAATSAATSAATKVTSAAASAATAATSAATNAATAATSATTNAATAATSAVTNAATAATSAATSVATAATSAATNAATAATSTATNVTTAATSAAVSAATAATSAETNAADEAAASVTTKADLFDLDTESSNYNPGNNSTEAKAEETTTFTTLQNEVDKEVDEDFLSKQNKFMDSIENGEISVFMEMLYQKDELDLDLDGFRDANGLSPLRLAISKGYSGIVELLLNNGASVGDGLLRAVDIGFLETVQKICKYAVSLEKPEDRLAIIECHCENDDYHPDVTPIVLAAQRNEFVMVKVLIDAGCKIETDRSKKKQNSSAAVDDLQKSVGSLELHRALASEAYLTQFHEDPIDTAFILSDKLRSLADKDVEFKTSYVELADNVDQVGTELISHARNTEEILTVLTYYEKDTSNEDETDINRGPLPKISRAIDFQQKPFVAHPNCQQSVLAKFYGQLAFLRDQNTKQKLSYLLLMVLGFPILSLLYLYFPIQKVKQLVECP
ncbi:uncharacterized protein [Amphiura filiformis]|uniref:uncharacterized protein n=1 Tax=Amphiura filiformis TaxID=82378 RepID=UPI003B214337